MTYLYVVGFYEGTLSHKSIQTVNKFQKFSNQSVFVENLYNCLTTFLDFKTVLVKKFLKFVKYRMHTLVTVCTYIITTLQSGLRPSFSHHLYVVCVNFIYEWRNLQFKVDSQRQIFWETFHGNLLCVFARNLLIGSRRRNTFCILL